MEKIIYQSNDEISIKYIAMTLLSLLTFRKIHNVEVLRKKLKEQQERENDYYRL